MNAHMNTFTADAPIRFNHKINLIAGRDRLLVELLIHQHPSYAGYGQLGVLWWLKLKKFLRGRIEDLRLETKICENLCRFCLLRKDFVSKFDEVSTLNYYCFLYYFGSGKLYDWGQGAAWDEILKKVNDAGGKGNEIGVSTLKQRHKNLFLKEAEGDRGKAMKKQLASEEEVQKQAAADKVVERATLLKSNNPLRVVEQKKLTNKVEGSSSGHLVHQSTADFSDAREMLKSFRDELSSMVAGISDGEVLTSMRRLEKNVERGFLAIETRQRTLEQRQALLEERQACFEYNMQRYLL
ncbi:hypothetical protein PHYBLDRAFT_62885 [Phycomyces blakesleeanus NRRL 1555(-)]|uniref:Uncharacterized protein n=1 Tax=Phycomyces blakesleeanus (strain ATCC 8743b / DSM 1359 / FGSC 10004 / NBRC 33097 / NRRL 1555) TaxID=763407 RepID=A0A163E686_PHYB8|nr:hypothetical protein PHYBLDRAFT_62885 [Phycomyces blakesleeanus NRRL 1555(-)]OAD76930.1 hypothetical protein PHYBLDRAFT_62885 [Phycomyces blakesleeanus NRRL 1555(-)]|eukprot:XP_018294970.1 hypothetical protein PHYBLDRAFT_62885 [Phycomyces blakesleeanus NRRL 1555(-)]